MKNKIWKIVVPVLKATSAIKTTLLGLTWTCLNTARFLFGANASVSISEPRR